MIFLKRTEYWFENIPHHQVDHDSRGHQGCQEHQLFQQLNEKAVGSQSNYLMKIIHLQFDHEHQGDQEHHRNQVQYHLKQQFIKLLE